MWLANNNSRRTIRATLVAAASVVAVSGVVVGVANAQSLKELRAREAENTALANEAAYTQSVCSNDLSASIDWRSAADWPASASLVGACDGALGALEVMCRTGAGRTNAQEISHFTCAGDRAGASLRGEVLRYGATPGGNGFADTKAVLDSKF